MVFNFAYGNGNHSVSCLDSLSTHQINRNTSIDPVQLALHAPIASKPLHQIAKPNHRVVILVSDITRPCPTRAILPLVLKELKQAKIPNNNIQIIVGTGLHRANTEKECESIVGSDVYNKYSVINTDPNNTHYVGTTSFGTPVNVFVPVYEADIRIAVGNIDLHYFAGFTGGYKAILSGVSSASTIQANHSMLHDPNARAGELLHNPVRQDMDDLDSMIPLHFIVNVVLDGSKVIQAVAGHPIHAHRYGCYISKYLKQAIISTPYDIVMVSAGGFPKDINLYQAQKVLDGAINAVTQDGVIILTAECRDGFGNDVFESWLLKKSHNEIKKDIRTKFVIGGHKAEAMVRALEKAQIYLVSTLPQDKVSQCQITGFDSTELAITHALNQKGKDAKIGVIPDGTSVYPFEYKS